MRAEADEKLANDVLRLCCFREAVKAIATIELRQLVVDKARYLQQPVGGAARNHQILHFQLQNLVGCLELCTLVIAHVTQLTRSLNSEAYFSRAEMGQRQVHHIVAQRSILVDAQVIARA